jgi:hypothetical protein
MKVEKVGVDKVREKLLSLKRKIIQYNFKMKEII